MPESMETKIIAAERSAPKVDRKFGQVPDFATIVSRSARKLDALIAKQVEPVAFQNRPGGQPLRSDSKRSVALFQQATAEQDPTARAILHAKANEMLIQESAESEALTNDARLALHAAAADEADPLKRALLHARAS